MSGPTGAPREEARALLLRVARREMRERGLEADFPPAALAESAAAREPAPPWGDGVRDLRDRLWCSIDNDDSLDLDQLTLAEKLPDGRTRVFVAVADVSGAVAPGSALDGHARANTTSVYTPPQIFPMLPPRLSTDLTSLNHDKDRPAMVVAVVVDGEGAATEPDVFRAVVRNRAKLAYSGVGAWLEGGHAAPPALASVAGLAENLRLQDDAAQRLKTRRHEHGALELETMEVRTSFDGDALGEPTCEERNRAKELIEDFMIAANGAIALHLESRRFPVLRRVVRSPERWQRIMELAAAHGAKLPPQPDAPALNAFLIARRKADPVRFPDLSLAVIKLMGRGEYVATRPGETPTGHFGLAVTEYTHSTAPNRRYPDLVTQRLLKAALAGATSPYGGDELDELAQRCTDKEDDAQRVERATRKAAAALWISDRIGQEFEGIVTGASEKGTWVRVFHPPVEGRIEGGAKGLDVGDKVRVRLVSTNPERGFIDFECVRCVGIAGHAR